jgi:hypothetical protein
VREPRQLPALLSVEEVTLLFAAAPGGQSTHSKTTSQPRQFAATIAARVGDRRTAQKSESIENHNNL